MVGVDTQRANDQGLFSIPEFLDIRDRSQSFEILAARTRSTVILTGHGQASRLAALRVTANHLPVWNIRLARGRPFGAHASTRSPMRRAASSWSLHARSLYGSPPVEPDVQVEAWPTFCAEPMRFAKSARCRVPGAKVRGGAVTSLARGIL